MTCDVIEFRPAIPASPDAIAVVKRLTTAQIKAAWDNWDDAKDPGCFIIEAIHAEMNARGEGCYVAV